MMNRKDLAWRLLKRNKKLLLGRSLNEILFLVDELCRDVVNHGGLSGSEITAWPIKYLGSKMKKHKDLCVIDIIFVRYSKRHPVGELPRASAFKPKISW